MEKLRRKEHNEKLLKGNTNQLGEIGVDNIEDFLLYVENKEFIDLANAFEERYLENQRNHKQFFYMPFLARFDCREIDRGAQRFTIWKNYKMH